GVRAVAANPLARTWTPATPSPYPLPQGEGSARRRRGRMLYRGMDRAALDAAYNNGAAVAEAPRFRADWAERSVALRARHAATLDIAYGAAPRARLDLFLAAPPGRAT